MIICIIFLYVNFKLWFKMMLLFLKCEGGYRCNENFERREKVVLNFFVFKILIWEGGYMLFYSLKFLNLILFIL